MTTPTVSLIVDTDNLRSTGVGLAAPFFEALIREISLDLDVEILLMHDEREVPRRMLTQLVDVSGIAEAPRTEIAFHDVPGLRYYEAKNAGARLARGEILVFIDTDVMLESPWLAPMLEPFTDPSIEIVTGSTYVGPWTDLYTKTFALFWNFDLPRPDGPPHEVPYIEANNFAVRRATFEQQQFPSDERYRGQCATYSRALKARGIRIWRVPQARTVHPPPRGFTTQRAVWRGHDLYLAARNSGDSWRTGMAGSLWLVGSYLKQSTARVLAGRRRVGLSRAEVPMALAIVGFHHAAVWAGYVVTRFAPDVLKRRWPL